MPISGYETELLGRIFRSSAPVSGASLILFQCCGRIHIYDAAPGRKKKAALTPTHFPQLM
jgi:hypothetical protein